MTLLKLRSFILCTALGMVCGAANADVYGFVENGRTKILYSDTKPSDPRYTLFRRDNHGQSQPGVRADTQSSGWKGIAPGQFFSHIMAAAKETNVEVALIRAVISVESGNNPAARSHAGAVGLMQLMPDTAKRYGVTDRLDPRQNIHGGARYLRDLKAMFNNNLQLVLAAYNAGEQAVMKYGNRIPPYAETTAYVPKVMRYYWKYRTAVPVGRAA